MKRKLWWGIWWLSRAPYCAPTTEPMSRSPSENDIDRMGANCVQ